MGERVKADSKRAVAQRMAAAVIRVESTAFEAAFKAVPLQDALDAVERAYARVAELRAGEQR